VNYLPGLASDRDPPDFCLLSNWDYRREPWHPADGTFFNQHCLQMNELSFNWKTHFLFKSGKILKSVAESDLHKNSCVPSLEETWGPGWPMLWDGGGASPWNI
jgi:hypothetical protein